jgi:transcriptional regulator with XRE-family HTH domain
MTQRLIFEMDFPERLATLRKERGLTQLALGEAAGVNVSQIRRYEGGTSQPTLEVLRKLAIALSVSADVLLFDKDERGPRGELMLKFEAVEGMEDEEKRVVVSLIDAYIKKHRMERLLAQ